MTVFERIFQLAAFFVGSLKQAENCPSLPETGRTVLPWPGQLFLRSAARLIDDCGIISNGTAGMVWIGFWAGAEGGRVHP